MGASTWAHVAVEDPLSPEQPSNAIASTATITVQTGAFNFRNLLPFETVLSLLPARRISVRKFLALSGVEC